MTLANASSKEILNFSSIKRLDFSRCDASFKNGRADNLFGYGNCLSKETFCKFSVQQCKVYFVINRLEQSEKAPMPIRRPYSAKQRDSKRLR